MGRSFKPERPAAFKLHVRFADGGKANLKSRDWKASSFQPEMGLLGLEKYILRHRDKIKAAKIYDHRQGRDLLVRHYCGGVWKTYLPITFNT